METPDVPIVLLVINPEPEDALVVVFRFLWAQAASNASKQCASNDA